MSENSNNNALQLQTTFLWQHDCLTNFWIGKKWGGTSIWPKIFSCYIVICQLTDETKVAELIINKHEDPCSALQESSQ